MDTSREENGHEVFRKSLPFCALAVRDALKGQKVMPEKIGHESGQISIWLQRHLEELGLPAICIDARSACKVLPAKLNRSDRSDAERSAQLAWIGRFAAVHLRSEDADRLRTIIGTRDRLVRLGMELEAHMRGSPTRPWPYPWIMFVPRMKPYAQWRLHARMR